MRMWLTFNWIESNSTEKEQSIETIDCVLVIGLNLIKSIIMGVIASDFCYELHISYAVVSGFWLGIS